MGPDSNPMPYNSTGRAEGAGAFVEPGHGPVRPASLNEPVYSLLPIHPLQLAEQLQRRGDLLVHLHRKDDDQHHVRFPDDHHDSRAVFVVHGGLGGHIPPPTAARRGAVAGGARVVGRHAQPRHRVA